MSTQIITAKWIVTGTSRDGDIQMLDDAAIAFVKPFRLRANLTGCWFAGLQAPFEDAHGVGHTGFNCALLLMHLVPRRSAAQMGQAGATDQTMRRVFMVQRWQDFAQL